MTRSLTDISSSVDAHIKQQHYIFLLKDLCSNDILTGYEQMIFRLMNDRCFTTRPRDIGNITDKDKLILRQHYQL